MEFDKHPMYNWLSETRRDFHMHPELSLEEFRTTKKIKETLTNMGIALQDLPDLEVGAVGIASGQSGGKTLALRADIDALPMAELNDVPYKSKNEGVMHSCGHDCHATIILGVAKKIMEEKIIDQLTGKIKFLFQPAEERASGAELIIKAGALENPSVDRILGAHINSEIPVGQVGLFKSVSHAITDTFRVNIKGKGVHGAYPHVGIDPIAAGAYFVSAVQTIVSRNIDPTDSAVVTVGQFQAGTAPNIIPEQALLTGTVRAFKDEVREKIILRLTEIAESLEKAYKVEVDYQYIDGVPIVLNDETVTAELFETAVKILGEENVYYMKPQMGGEDFGLYTQRIPGTFMKIGCRNPEKGIVHKGHSPYFDVDEASLAIGVEIFTEAVRSYLISTYSSSP